MGPKCDCGHYERDHANILGELGDCCYCACESFVAEKHDEDDIPDGVYDVVE